MDRKSGERTAYTYLDLSPIEERQIRGTTELKKHVDIAHPLKQAMKGAPERRSKAREVLGFLACRNRKERSVAPSVPFISKGGDWGKPKGCTGAPIGGFWGT